MNKNRRFTPVEVLIVVIILAIVVGIVKPRFSNASTDAKLNALTSELQMIRGRIQLYKVQHDDAWPTATNFANQLTFASKGDGTTAGVGTAGYSYGPYLQAVPNNPFTNANTIGTGTVGSSDWYYDETTGQFRANNAASYLGY